MRSSVLNDNSDKNKLNFSKNNFHDLANEKQQFTLYDSSMNEQGRKFFADNSYYLAIQEDSNRIYNFDFFKSTNMGFEIFVQ
uniref:Uncharacterized protein n=1 Tax=Romanomermis culicivorax TaxID=13658 RepID=A0A915K1G7_ROMCU